MITLRKLAYECMRLEEGGDSSADSQLSEAYMIMLARQAANGLIMPLVYEDLGQDDRSGLHMLTVRFEVQVQGADPNKYAVLPEAYAHIPLFNQGLKGVAPIEDPTNEFIPRHTPAVSRNLPCSDLETGQHSYYTEGDRVYFDDHMDLQKVLMKLIIAAPESLGPDDALFIYPEQQFRIIGLMRQMLQNRPPQDKILDGNPDIGVKVAR